MLLSSLHQLLLPPIVASNGTVHRGSHNNNQMMIGQQQQQQQQQQQHIVDHVQQQVTDMVNIFWNTNDDDDNNSKNRTNSWKTLPYRVQQLVVSTKQVYEMIQQLQLQQQQQQEQQLDVYHNSKMMTLQDLSTIVTASILVQQQQQQQNAASNCNTTTLMRSFTDFFVAALTYHTMLHHHRCQQKQQQHQQEGMEDENGEEEGEECNYESISSLVENESDIEHLYQVFGTISKDTPLSSSSIASLLFQNIRYLGWIQQPDQLMMMIATVDTDEEKKTKTTNGSATSFLLQESLVAALQKIITKQSRIVIEEGTGNNNTSYEFMIQWTNQLILPWLINDVFGVYRSMNNGDHNNSVVSSKVTVLLQDMLHTIIVQSFWSLRLNELFDIVTSYPDSIPIIQELQIIFHQLVQKGSTKTTTTMMYQRAQQKRIHELAQSLRSTFMVRLNHPGATTTQMIDIYIAAMQVLRMLFNENNTTTDRNNYNTNASLNHINTTIAYITEPIRSYLRNHRTDTVRCILSSLTNTTTADSTTTTGATDAVVGVNHVLYQELRRQDTKPLDYMTMNSDDEEDDEEECPTMDWQPRPSIYSYPHQQQRFSSHHHRSGGGSSSGSSNRRNDSDILAMLVSIYGSKELFVNEYRSMLADKMLSNNYVYNIDQDIHTLELLKLRFGEMSLLNAEVMIKDIEDSARINKNVRDSYMTKQMNARTKNNRSSIEQVDTVVDAAIVSHIFWPKLYNTEFKHHPRIQSMLDEYSTIYAEQKNPRTLQWYNPLGSVTLEVDVMEDQMNESTGKISRIIETKEFTCSPIHATLISYFEDKADWTAEQLSNVTNVPEHIIIKQLSYWITHHVIVCRTSSSSSKYYGTLNSPVYTLATKATNM